jgi:hypothetical protein
MEDKTQGEMPEYILPDTEDSMEICDPEPSPNTPATSSPVAAKRSPLFLFHKKIREFFGERAKTKQKNGTRPEETDMAIPMDTT